MRVPQMTKLGLGENNIKIAAVQQTVQRSVIYEYIKQQSSNV